MHHIHVYFTTEQKNSALKLRELVAMYFPDIHLGRVHDNPVGPHPVGSYEIDVPTSSFETLKAFLEAHSMGLTMMIHPLTGDDIEDHKEENVSWIGAPMEINRHFFTPKAQPCRSYCPRL